MDKKPLESYWMKKPEEEIGEADDIIKFLRGPKGDKGDKGEDSKAEEVAEFIVIPVVDELKKDEDFIEKIRGEKGESIKGEDGKDAEEVDIVEIAERVAELLPQQEIDVKKLEKSILAKIPKIVEKEEASADDLIEKLHTSKKKIKKTLVEGIDDMENMVRNSSRQMQNFIQMGGATQLRVKNNGTPLGAIETINFINPTLTVPQGGDGREVNVGFNVGSTSILPATGVVNSGNLSFTFTVKPSIIVSDGAMYRETVGWTWNAGTLTATMIIPPNNDIFGIQ